MLRRTVYNLSQKLLLQHFAESIRDHKMKQTQTYLTKVILSAAALFLFRATTVRSATPTAEPQSAATPTPSLSFATRQLDNSTMDKPRVLQSHRPCGSDHANYCHNGGQCMYPQDSDGPSCICAASYGGPRCMFIVNTISQPKIYAEQLIGIVVGLALVVFALIFVICYCSWKKCIKSSKLIKPTLPESTV
ncbi:protransforming growth factor alpha [Thalassophryne amazonica]|uniref:protransforming growth factor alpha n=1 Tax=Thalassophryne amazonica TaxID=390379 RepID=UPI0014724916|nr:protransforming growth factor alpha [Thalassophryne amazonica]